MAARPWLAMIVLVAGGIAAGWYWMAGRGEAVPDGFARANGRIEAERIDIAARFAGRIETVLVAEGDLVEAGQVLARMDATRIRAELREAEANARQAEQRLLEAKAMLAQRQSELVFVEQEVHRAERLGDRGFVTGEEVDLRRSQLATAQAAILSAKAGIARAEAGIDAARATVDRLEADLAEYKLTTPTAGRVQYRLAEPGEIVESGGRIVTLIDLSDVYMTVYLPTGAAGRLRYGAEARVIFDAAPQYVVPASVTFVASEAQFTPKYVEVESEREKLMFRVKVTIPPDLLRTYRDVVKAGVPGLAWIRIDPAASWPAALAVRLPDVP